MRENADLLEGNPYNGSKSLVSAKKGFTPYFKSLAVGELLQQCPHPSLLTKALTVMESYEAAAVCRVIGLLQSGEVGWAALVKLSWIPQSIKGATLSELKARERFLLGKAAQSPGLDRWKQWSGVNDRPYVSKQEKKRQRGHQELCLMTLQDCDSFYKSAKRAVDGGKSYDTWLHSDGRKIFHSWSQRAASSGMVPPPQQPGFPTNSALGGRVPTGVLPAGIVGMGRTAAHPAVQAGGQPLASGSGAPQDVQNMSLLDKLTQLTLLMQNTELREYIGKNNVFSKPQ